MIQISGKIDAKKIVSTEQFFYIARLVQQEKCYKGTNKRQKIKQWHYRKTEKIPLNLVWDLSAFASDSVLTTVRSCSLSRDAV